MISEELHIKAGTFKTQAFMDKLLDLLKKNYSNAEYGVDEFSVDMVSAEAYYTKTTQELTGTAIGELLRNHRLNIAKEILIANGHTLNIPYQVGFNDRKIFTRCFTKHFNVPPASSLKIKNGECPFYVHIPRFYPSVYFCPLIISPAASSREQTISSGVCIPFLVNLMKEPCCGCLHSSMVTGGMEILHTFICLIDTVLPVVEYWIYHPPSTVAHQLEAEHPSHFRLPSKRTMSVSLLIR